MKLLKYSLSLLGLALGCFGLCVTSVARAEVKAGTSSHYQDNHITQITIRGASADALFDDLAAREGVEVKDCNGGVSVSVEPMLCIRKTGMETLCLTNLFPNMSAFTVPKICDEGPQQSIIGVGNGNTPGITKGTLPKTAVTTEL